MSSLSRWIHNCTKEYSARGRTKQPDLRVRPKAELPDSPGRSAFFCCTPEELSVHFFEPRKDRPWNRIEKEHPSSYSRLSSSGRCSVFFCDSPAALPRPLSALCVWSPASGFLYLWLPLRSAFRWQFSVFCLCFEVFFSSRPFSLHRPQPILYCAV